jgi:hypothetical protein
MILAIFLRFAILVGLILPNPSWAEEIPILGALPSDIREIDITYSESGPPRLAFRSSPPPHPSASPYRPSTASFDLLPRLKTAAISGTCHASTTTRAPLWSLTIRSDKERCRTIIQFRPAALDLLSYPTLAIKGVTSSPIILQMSDMIGEQLVPLGHVSGRFDQRLSLTPVMRTLDPTHVTTLVIEVETGHANLTLEGFSIERASATAQPGSRKGFWMWDYRRAVADTDSLIRECHLAGATRLLVQMPHGDDPADIWSAYAELLKKLSSSGLEVFALDGYPEAIYDSTPLIEKVKRLRSLLIDEQWTGLQLDIEPYLLDRFSDPHDYDLYLQVIEHMRLALGDHVRLSIVMPFWFSDKTARDRPLAFQIMDRADEVAVMSYRTDLEELEDITEPILRYGDALGVPVWLAVETRPLPVDRQVTLVRARRSTEATAYLDRRSRRLVLAPPPRNQIERFRVAHRITIRPERLTFAGNTRSDLHSALATILALPHKSLAGVLIHDIDGYLSLTE